MTCSLVTYLLLYSSLRQVNSSADVKVTLDRARAMPVPPLKSAFARNFRGVQLLVVT